MSQHRAPRRKRRPSLPAGFARWATAGSACVAATGAAVVVGVMTTSQAAPDGVASSQPGPLDRAAQQVVAAPPVEAPAEVPVEVRPVAGFEEPATLEATSGAGRYVPARVTPLGEQSVEAIPAVATAAYQRAETVIGAARPGCHLTWPVLAAVGRVESDHGRADGGHLSARGLAVPSRYGATLDGRRGRAEVRDTDAGALDGHRRWDRTMGPLNFLPTTWTVVGVDSDGDGRRDPQDLDDAALAAAVVLCGRGVDLAEPAGLVRALRNLNRADGYGETVVATAEAYTTELEEIAEAEPVVVELPTTATTPTEPAQADGPRAARQQPGRGREQEPVRPSPPAPEELDLELQPALPAAPPRQGVPRRPDRGRAAPPAQQPEHPTPDPGPEQCEDPTEAVAAATGAEPPAEAPAEDPELPICEPVRPEDEPER